MGSEGAKGKAGEIMGKTIRTEAVNALFDAILTLETKEECFAFFEDVCTVNEVLSIAQRYSVAKMLKDNHTYLEVANETGASTATISRVNRSLNYGSDGYELVFKRLAKKEK
jgi:TrpR-related protein YerC/YecD